MPVRHSQTIPNHPSPKTMTFQVWSRCSTTLETPAALEPVRHDIWRMRMPADKRRCSANASGNFSGHLLYPQRVKADKYPCLNESLVYRQIWINHINGLWNQRISIGQGCSMAADQTIFNSFLPSPSNIGCPLSDGITVWNHLPFAVPTRTPLQRNEKSAAKLSAPARHQACPRPDAIPVKIPLSLQLLELSGWDLG